MNNFSGVRNHIALCSTLLSDPLRCDMIRRGSNKSIYIYIYIYIYRERERERERERKRERHTQISNLFLSPTLAPPIIFSPSYGFPKYNFACGRCAQVKHKVTLYNMRNRYGIPCGKIQRWRFLPHQTPSRSSRTSFSRAPKPKKALALT